MMKQETKLVGYFTNKYLQTFQCTSVVGRYNNQGCSVQLHEATNNGNLCLITDLAQGYSRMLNTDDGIISPYHQ